MARHNSISKGKKNDKFMAGAFSVYMGDCQAQALRPAVWQKKIVADRLTSATQHYHAEQGQQVGPSSR